jgi:lysophospholipid acyltransferase 1/2
MIVFVGKAQSSGITPRHLLWSRDVLILVGVIGVSYILLCVVPPTVVQRYTMVWVMGSLSVAHIYRTLTDYGGYHLDFSGPLMIIVQKLSLVAFAVHDGKGGNPRPLNKDQEQNKLESVPSILEYFSYTFNFLSILAGPAVTMREYLDFIDGSNLRPLDNPNQFARAKEHSQEPSTLYPVLSKFVLCLLAMALYLYLSDYPLHLVLDPSYNIIHRTWIIYIVTMRVKLGFYFIWLLADSINNAAGLGFSGYDALGNPQWDLASNIFFLEMELAMSVRTIANNWNLSTARWLRRVSFERVTWQPSRVTFVLSAVWHGFYPGYYACLLFLGMAVEASKKMRRLINPFFTSHGLVVKWSYHVVTWVLAHNYCYHGALALQLMWLPEVLIFWRNMYFIPIWTTLVVVFLLPSGKPHKSKGAEVATGNSTTTTPLVEKRDKLE